MPTPSRYNRRVRKKLETNNPEPEPEPENKQKESAVTFGPSIIKPFDNIEIVTNSSSCGLCSFFNFKFAIYKEYDNQGNYFNGYFFVNIYSVDREQNICHVYNTGYMAPDCYGYCYCGEYRTNCATFRNTGVDCNGFDDRLMITTRYLYPDEFYEIDNVE